MTENITKVGIGVVLLDRHDNILLGKRTGSHGEGEWALPGGSLEYGESFKACAQRELAEEVGTDIQYHGLHVVSVINLVEYMPKHYVDIGMLAYYDEGTPEVMEPHRCEEWRWFWMYNLPSKRFAAVDRTIVAVTGGPRFYDC